MAGAGFDAQMIREADAGLKDRIGRVAYVWTGVNELGRKPFEAKIKVDGSTWFDGKASSILFGNVGKLFAGVEAFEDARPDDGELELGVVTADGMLEWARTIARTAAGSVPRVSVRPGDARPEGQDHVRPQGPVRARRRRARRRSRSSTSRSSRPRSRSAFPNEGDSA